MKIAIIGYGKMGKMVEKAAHASGHEIVARLDRNWSTEDKKLLEKATVCIDFSKPEAALQNIKNAASLKKNIVMGTTGWYQHLDEAKQIVKETGIGFIYAPNFSIGVALFLKIVQETAALIAPHTQYEVAGFEIHHKEKLDAPSGTALSIVNKLKEAMPNCDASFSSVRVGSVPGTHSVIFDSAVDTITLTHTARNREGFAEGAIKAALWLEGKKGFFTIEDMLK